MVNSCVINVYLRYIFNIRISETLVKRILFISSLRKYDQTDSEDHYWWKLHVLAGKKMLINTLNLYLHQECSVHEHTTLGPHSSDLVEGSTNVNAVILVFI